MKSSKVIRRPLAGAALIFGLVLTGCAVGPRYQRPSIAISKSWSVDQTAGTNSAEPSVQWWKSFHDDEFNRLIERAVSANLDLKLAAARVSEARAQAGIAKSGLMPTVDASASASRNRQRVIAVSPGSPTSARLVPIEFNNYQGGFDASWELDVFGSLRRGLQAANADTRSAVEARRDILVTLLGDVGRSYIELRGFQLRREIAEKNITIQQDTLHLTEARAKAGMATELDVSRARAQLETTESIIPTLQSGIENSIHHLSVLLGEEPETLGAELLPAAPVPLLPPQVPTGMPSGLLERRPDIRVAEAQVIAATARVGEAKANFFPRFLLLGTAARQASQLHDLTLGMGNVFGAGPAISLPIFTAGRLRAQLHVQDARMQQAATSYRKVVLSALEETEDALVNYSQEQKRRQRLENAVKSSEEAVQLSSETYRAGLTDFLSVLDAERELYANEDLLAQSRTTQAVNLVALYKALGGGWQTNP